MKKTVTGLFGGTFAPPHLGHVNAAKAFVSQIDPDELLVMPTCIPPHKIKTGIDTAEIRFEMCRAAFAGIPKTVVSDYEIKQNSVSYTYLTLNHLMEENPERKIYMLCGTDMFLTLDKWRNSDRIFALADMVCAVREKDGYDRVAEKAEFYRREYGRECIILKSEVTEISSSEIRERIMNGLPLDGMVQPEVTEIIDRYNLYRKGL